MINAALGFDTFLVQRHGVRSSVPEVVVDPIGAVGGHTSNAAKFRKVVGSELGCYFCNDVVAPGNVNLCLHSLSFLSPESPDHLDLKNLHFGEY